MRYQNLMVKHYNTKVKPRHFQVRDLVLRRAITAMRDLVLGKLGPNWEGHYKIVDYNKKGTYYLETLDERKLHHPWNTKHLRKYYQ